MQSKNIVIIGMACILSVVSIIWMEKRGELNGCKKMVMATLDDQVKMALQMSGKTEEITNKFCEEVLNTK